MVSYEMSGKVAIVTGGAQGLGRKIVERFLEAKATVVFTDLNATVGDKTVTELREQGHSVDFIQGNIAKEDDVKNLIDQTVARCGKIDYFINNAALTSQRTPFHEIEMSHFGPSVDVNVKGTFICMKNAITQMLTQPNGGCIVNVSSTVAVIATRGLAAYGASKAAINNMTEVAAAEYAGRGIRVNAVMPGPMLTESMLIFKEQSPDAYNAVVENSLMKRMAQPEEIANAVIWLCSDDASYVTGEKVFVDGGQYVNNIN